MPELGSDQATPARPISPLCPAGPATDDSAGVVIEDLCLLTKLTVRAAAASAVAATVGVRFGRAAWHGEILRVGAGPDEWHLLGPTGSSMLADTRHALVAVPGLVSVLDISHGRGLVRMRGPRVSDLLARLTAFDLDDRFVPDGAAFRTSVASVVTDVVRDDRDGPSYLLHCERSSARWLVDSFLTAGADFGATLVDGAWAQPAQ